MVYDHWPTDFLRFLPRAAYGFLTDFCFLADGFCTDFCRSAYGLLTDYCFMGLPWCILALIVTLKKYCVNYKWSTIIGLQISYGFYPELLTDSVRISAGQPTDSLRIIALWLGLDTSRLWLLLAPCSAACVWELIFSLFHFACVG